MDQQNPENQSQPQNKEKFDPKKPPDKNNLDDIYRYVAKRISGPSFRNPLKNFIDENCITFIDVDENTFEQGQLFKELNQLLENLLQEVLKEGDLTQEDFLVAAEKGINDPKYKKYFNQVINFGDYNFFKSIMTKRNYQIIKMAEQQMENAQSMKQQKQEQEQPKEIIGDPDQKTKELLIKLMEEENKDLDEAIKQSLVEEDKRRRIAAIEEEEMRRAVQMSLMNTDEKPQEKKEEEEKKPEPEKKKEEPPKEPPKEAPKKFVPVISNVSNFQFDSQVKPEKKESPPKEIIPKKNNEENKFKLESSNTNVQIEYNPYAKKRIKQPEPEPELEKKKEEENKNEIKPEEVKNEIKPEPDIKEDKKDIDINIDNAPKKEERITRENINIFEEKKRTLKPLVNKPKIGNNIINNKGPNKPSLMQDLQKRKGNIKEDIERMKIKNENKPKVESALDIIKQNIEKDKNNNNDIVNLEEDDGGLLINDENEEDEKKNEYVSKHNIHFGKIEIPSNFNGKIPEYTKENQDALQDFRDFVIKNKINERENEEDDI